MILLQCVHPEASPGRARLPDVALPLQRNLLTWFPGQGAQRRRAGTQNALALVFGLDPVSGPGQGPGSKAGDTCGVLSVKRPHAIALPRRGRARGKHCRIRARRRCFPDWPDILASAPLVHKYPMRQRRNGRLERTPRVIFRQVFSPLAARGQTRYQTAVPGTFRVTRSALR